MIMTVEEMKLEISDRTGIPLTMIQGDTPGEALAFARSLIEYKNSIDDQEPKSNAEKLGVYLFGENESSNTELESLECIEKQYNYEQGGYPVFRDNGNVLINGVSFGDPRSPGEQFAEWFGNKTAFNPNKENGWTKLI